MMPITAGNWQSKTVNGETFIQSDDTTFIAKLYEASGLREANAKAISLVPDLIKFVKEAEGSFRVLNMRVMAKKAQALLKELE